MRAVFLTKQTSSGGIFEIRETEIPLPKENEVQLKVSHFGINFADVMAGRGLYRDAPDLPAILGYESVGVISAIGKNIDRQLLGKRILAFTRFGSYAEYVCTTVDGIIELPDTITNKNALPLATQYSTAWYASMEMVNLHKNDVVLIHAAAGGVGSALIQLCKWKGCEIIALSGNDEKKEYILNNGAHHFINYKKTDYAAQIKKLFPGGIDVSFNAVAGSTFKKDRALLSVGGRIVLFGAAERMNGKMGILSSINLLLKMGFYSPVFMMMKTEGFIGFNMLKVANEKPEVLKRCLTNVVELAKQGILNPHTSRIFRTSELHEAHKFLASGKNIGKIGISWG